MRFGLKIACAILCAVSLLFSVCGMFMINYSYRSSLDREQESAMQTYRGLVETIVTLGIVTDWDTAQDYGAGLSHLTAAGNTQWDALQLVIDNEIAILQGNESLLSKAKSQNSEAEKSSSDDAALTSWQNVGNDLVLLISGEYDLGSRRLGLTVARSCTSLSMSYERELEIFRVALIVLIVVCSIATFIIAWVLTRPLRRMWVASSQIANGNLSFRSKVHTDDELGTLSKQFDEMASKVEKGVTDMKQFIDRERRFTSSFAHEMKTPMTSIIGYADLIRRNQLSEDERSQAAGYIFSEGKRLENLSQKLLSLYVMNQAPELVPCEVGKLVYEVVEPLRPQWFEQGIALDAYVENGACLLDAELVNALLVNLLENARRAIDGSGNVRVVCSMTETGCRISVMDNGRGIPPQHLEHLTEEFYRVDKARSRDVGGAGLGLSLCKKIVEVHGGHLSIESEMGRGTCVTATFSGGRL